MTSKLKERQARGPQGKQKLHKTYQGDGFHKISCPIYAGRKKVEDSSTEFKPSHSPRQLQPSLYKAIWKRDTAEGK